MANNKNKISKIKKIGNVHNFVLLSKSHVEFRLEVVNLKQRWHTSQLK
jgi:hypothetical protein